MDPWEMLEAQVAVVATLGELVATMTAPHRHVWPILDPESLHAALREFTWTLWDALDYHGIVTSRGKRTVSSLSQALAALKATPEATWADVRNAVRAWLESVDGLQERWEQVFREAEKFFDTSMDEALAAIKKQQSFLRDQVEKTNSLLTARAAHVATARHLLAITIFVTLLTRIQARADTRTRQWAREVCRLLRHLEDACGKARELSCGVQDLIRQIKSDMNKRDKASPDDLKGLEASLAKAKLVSEASACPATDHLLGILGDIHDLLLSPWGGSGGSDGPSGRSVAEQGQEAIKDIPRPCQEQRTAPLSGKTNNGSSIPGKPEQPEGTWGKPEPGAVCETASHLPSHPKLLPPGTRCELATSKSIDIFKNCYQWIQIGVTGTSQQSQDFLIIGKDSNRTLGLSVIPAVVSVNCNEELRVLALAYNVTMKIEPKTPIAIAIALPMKRNKRAGNVRWIEHITNEKPELTCSLTHRDKTVHIKGKLDTGSDLTVISYKCWPKGWSLVPPDWGLTGIGGDTVCMQSESMITVTGPEGKTATTRPCVVKEPIVLWGRDVLSQWRAKMEVDS